MREKVVAEMAERFVVVVDESKCVDVLGRFGLPLEVLDFAPGVLEARLRALGAHRISRRDARSDNGNLLLDAWWEAEGTDAYVATRVKMGESTRVFAVVKADGKLYSASKETKVTLGGCGG